MWGVIVCSQVAWQMFVCFPVPAAILQIIPVIVLNDWIFWMNYFPLHSIDIFLILVEKKITLQCVAGWAISWLWTVEIPHSEPRNSLLLHSLQKGNYLFYALGFVQSKQTKYSIAFICEFFVFKCRCFCHSTVINSKPTNWSGKHWQRWVWHQFSCLLPISQKTFENNKNILKIKKM